MKSIFYFSSNKNKFCIFSNIAILSFLFVFFGSTTTNNNIVLASTEPQISVENVNSLALKSDGTVWAWGRNKKWTIG